MAKKLVVGDCVRVPDGRIGRIRARVGTAWRVRVRRPAGTSDQFLVLAARVLRRVPTPSGWMSPDGYRRYLKATLTKLRARLR